MFYEVDIKDEFYLNLKHPYLGKKQFIEIAKLNNIKITDLDIKDESLPMWKLFQIQLKQYSNQVFLNTTRLKPDFKDYINCFEEVTMFLNNNLSIDELSINSQRYKDFFQYLINLHYELKQHQQYKLMWNLEHTYIRTVIDICLENSIEYSTLEELTRHRQIPYLYTIYRGNDFKYFESQSHYFSGVINYFEKYKNLSKDKCFELLFSNKKYYDTLHTIIELNEQTFKNRYKDYILTSLVRGIVLNIEELIKNKIKDNKDFFEEKIKLIEEKESEKRKKDFKFKYFDLEHYLQILSDVEKFKKIQPKLEFSNEIDKHKRYSKQINFLSGLQCKEKYFLIFQKTRNYVAHNHIDFQQLFNDNAEKVSSILDSIIFILIYLEMLKNKADTTQYR